MEESCLPESKNDRKGCAKGLWECRHLSGILRESWGFRPVQPCSVVCQLLAPSNASPGKGADCVSWISRLGLDTPDLLPGEVKMNENSSSIPNAHLGLERKQSLEMGIPRARANPASPQGSGLPLTPLGLLRLPLPTHTHTHTHTRQPAGSACFSISRCSAGGLEAPTRA